jgi:hypothetical protein
MGSRFEPSAGPNWRSLFTSGLDGFAALAKTGGSQKQCVSGGLGAERFGNRRTSSENDA